MNLARRGNAYNTAMLFMIVLILLTIAFGLLGYFKLNDAHEFRYGVEGGTEEIRDPETALQARLDEKMALEERIEFLRATIADRQYELHDINVILADEGSYRDPETGEWLVGGPDDNQRMWMQTKIHVVNARRRLEGLRDGFFGHNDMHSFDFFEDTQDLFERGSDARGREVRGIDDILEQIDRNDARVEEEDGRLRDEIDDIETEAAQAELEHNDRMAELETRRGQLEARIRELLDLRLIFVTEIQPDGQVMRTTSDRSQIMIDIGSADRVARGIKFEVFRYDRGTFQTKGMVEVIDVQGHWATCRVLSEVDSRRLPISQGDYVGNPVFDKTDPKMFLLAGDFVRYNKADLATFIRASGGEVAERLGPGVDYLVAGQRSDSIQEAARQYQLMAMTEDQLVRYLQPNFERE